MIERRPVRIALIAAITIATWLIATIVPKLDVRLLAAAAVALEVALLIRTKVESPNPRFHAAIQVISAAACAALVMHFAAHVLGAAYPVWVELTAKPLFPAAVVLAAGAITLFDQLF